MQYLQNLFTNYRPAFRHYQQLTKSHLSLLNTFVASTAFLTGGGSLLKLPLLAISTQCMAMSSQIFNQLIERPYDAMMIRTCKRPLVTGQISRGKAWVVGSVLTVIGLCCSYALNPATALIATAIWASYLFVYTPMKRYSKWNTLVGAMIGSGTVYMGWMATGSHPCLCQPFAFFLYMLAWQMQHFWGIRWIYKNDYDKCFKMENNHSVALFQAAITMGIALIAGNYSLTYCMSNPCGILNLIFSASIFKFGFRSLLKFERDEDPRKLKKDSYLHFVVFMVIQAIVILGGRSSQPRQPFRQTVPQVEQIAWQI